MDLAEFLLARFTEDEAVAREAVRWSEGASEWADAGEPDWVHIARHDPARVLAECEAKRRIVALVTDSGQIPWDRMAPANRDVLQLLSLPYADHPNYQPEWKA